MFENIFNSHIIGLEFQSEEIIGAEFACSGRHPKLKKLFTYQPDQPLPNTQAIIVTAIEGNQALVRPVYLPLLKEKDIREALPFQVEPLLPYPIDQAILAHRIIESDEEGSVILLFAAHESSMQTHLERWAPFKIVPEKIGVVPVALCDFVLRYLTDEKPLLAFHLSNQCLTGVFIENKQVKSSFSVVCQLSKEGYDSENLVQNISKIALSLTRESKTGTIQGFILTGELSKLHDLTPLIVNNLSIPSMHVEPLEDFSIETLHQYAVPIGLALGASPKASQPIDFRQEQFSYPHPWKHYAKPLALYLLLVCAFTFGSYFLSNSYLSYQASLHQQSFIDLLSKMEKSYDKFEQTFLTKTKQSTYFDEKKWLTYEELDDRLHFLQKEIQATPESFPLFPNVPRVSDVLAWLSHHPAIVFTDVDGGITPRIKLESFNYTMVKRPMQGKKQDRYQIKIDLEISSTTPKWAREFHDALLAPNEWVDPKSEVKWNSNRGKYRTTFFLKDKTTYPGLST